MLRGETLRAQGSTTEPQILNLCLSASWIGLNNFTGAQSSQSPWSQSHLMQESTAFSIGRRRHCLIASRGRKLTPFGGSPLCLWTGKIVTSAFFYFFQFIF